MQEWLSSWKTLGNPAAQIAENVENESALSEDRLADFLREAAERWRHGGISLDAFAEILCTPRQRYGGTLNPPAPQWVGRVEKIGTFLYRRQQAEMGVSQESLLRELALAVNEPAALPRQMDADLMMCAAVAALPMEPESGSIFTMFREDRTSAAFDDDLRRRERAIQLLGLGLFPQEAWALAITYQPGPAGLALHVPTICDAGSYHYFRPAPAAAGSDPEHGLTCPLADCVGGAGKPEVVHRDCGWLFVGLV